MNNERENKAEEIITKRLFPRDRLMMDFLCIVWIFYNKITHLRRRANNRVLLLEQNEWKNSQLSGYGKNKAGRFYCSCEVKSGVNLKGRGWAEGLGGIKWSSLGGDPQSPLWSFSPCPHSGSLKSVGFSQISFFLSFFLFFSFFKWESIRFFLFCFFLFFCLFAIFCASPWVFGCF